MYGPGDTVGSFVGAATVADEPLDAAEAAILEDDVTDEAMVDDMDELEACVDEDVLRNREELEAGVDGDVLADREELEEAGIDEDVLLEKEEL